MEVRGLLEPFRLAFGIAILEKILIRSNVYTVSNMNRFMELWLDIRRAPEPEVIFWENYNLTLKSRRLRTVFVSFVSIILLLVCLASVFV